MIAISAITACSVDDNNNNYCFYNGQMTTLEVTGPTTTTVNVPVTLNVTFRVANSCGAFNRFVQTTTFPKNIVALVDYSGCQCTDTPSGSLTKPYTFTATAAGTYELRFLQENNLYITRTITVTE